MDRTLLDLLVRILAWFCGIRYRKNRTLLHHGTHEIALDLGETPKRVWVALDEDHLVPTCVGNVDYVSTQIVDGGFVLYANINSAHRHLYWFARLQ